MNIKLPKALFMVTLALCALFLVVYGELATITVSAATQSGQMLSPDDYKLLRDIGWQTEEWTGNDAPFEAARASIDRQFASKTNIGTTVDFLETAAEKQPTNALDQFCYAYAIFKQCKIPHARQIDCTPVCISLAKANTPHSYEYDRVRFLLEDPSFDELAIANRLSEKDPTDVFVLEQRAFVLSMSKSSADCDAAVKMQQKVADSGEDSPACWAFLAEICADAGFTGHNDNDYRLSIQANRRFLELTPKIDWHRELAEHSISVLQQRLANGN